MSTLFLTISKGGGGKQYCICNHHKRVGDGIKSIFIIYKIISGPKITFLKQMACSLPQ